MMAALVLERGGRKCCQGFSEGAKGLPVWEWEWLCGGGGVGRYGSRSRDIEVVPGMKVV